MAALYAPRRPLCRLASIYRWSYADARRPRRWLRGLLPLPPRSAYHAGRPRGIAMRKLARRLVCISCGGIALLVLETARLGVACRRLARRRYHARRRPTWG